MKAPNRQTIRIIKVIGYLGALITIGSILIVVLAHSSTMETVAQAQGAHEQQSVNAQDAADNVIAFAPTQGNEIPNPSFSVSVANDITFSAGNYRLDDTGKLAIDFCFDQIDTGDWTIWNSHVADKQGFSAALSEGDLLEIRFPPIIIDGKLKQHIMDFRGETSNEIKDYYVDADTNQKIGRRCVSMSYNLPQKFDLSSFTVIVDNILAYPDENTQCSEAAILNIQKILDERQTGIKVELKTDFSDGGGICGVEVVQKPGNMSLDEAMFIVSGDEMIIDLYGIRGPWVFEGIVK